MKRNIIVSIVILICIGSLSACSKQTESEMTTNEVVTNETIQLESTSGKAISNEEQTEAYETLISFKVNDYEKESIGEFNRSIMPEDEDLSELLDEQADVMESISAEDENYDFIVYTFALSLQELYCEQLGDEPVYSGVASKKAGQMEELNDEQEPTYEFLCYVFYDIEYTILDSKQLMVADRDDAIQTFQSEFQCYIDSLSEEELVSNDIKQTVSAKAEEIAENLSTEQLGLTCEISSMEIQDSGTEILK